MSSPLPKRASALLRAKRSVVRCFVDKLKSKSLAPGDLRRMCDKLRRACPEAFVLHIRDDVVGDSFHAFVKSVYNSLNYAKLCEGSGTTRRRRNTTTQPGDTDPDDPLIVDPLVS